jgi:hypothetical protein
MTSITSLLDRLESGNMSTMAKRHYKKESIFLDEKEELKEAVVNIPYKDFLDSYYWDFVKRLKSLTIGSKNKKCVICDSQKSLSLHHKTYKNHGSEHNHLEDLIFVCHRCHSMIHENIDIGRNQQFIHTSCNPLTFDEFWDKFDKKREKKAAFRIWKKLTESEKSLMYSHIDYYLHYKPNKKFRMYPANYLAHFCKGTAHSKMDIQITRDITHFIEDGKIYVR